jgi:hypothetical protein
VYVDNVVSSAGSLMRVPFFRYMMPAHVLYQEIRHYIHAVHKPINEEREDVAEDWGRKLYAQFVRRHYWYVCPVLYAVSVVVSPIAKVLRRRRVRASNA